MKKILFLALIMFVTVEAKPLKSLSQALEMWTPLSINIKNKQLMIVTNEAKVTEKMYNSMLLLGVCKSVWDNGLKSLNGASEINILNKYKHQGYVFEGGAEACKELGELNGKGAEFFILNRTHLY